MALTHLSLFTGIGGLDIAAEWAGFETVGQCEWADYPQKVLTKHWPDVPKWRDIKTLTGEDFYEKTGSRTVDIISGGFPCQPFRRREAKRQGMMTVTSGRKCLESYQKSRPNWVIGENVAGIVSMGESASFSKLEDDRTGSTEEKMVLEEICQALENIGYDVQPFLIPACSVSAPHQRYRTFIVGHAKHDGQPAESELRSDETASNDRGTQEQDATGEFTRTDRPINVSGILGCTDGCEQLWPGHGRHVYCKSESTQQKPEMHSVNLSECVQMWPTPTQEMSIRILY